MKTNKEQLRELLKTNSEVKEQLEELKFGCEIEVQDKNFKIVGNYKKYGNEIFECKELTCEHRITSRIKENITKIIGNPLSEHHLRMYLYTITKRNNGIVHFAINGGGVLSSIIDGDMETLKDICKLDNSKSLENQSEEVLGQILDYLNNK